jgi:DNA-binding transcriptional LysR family regulator
VQRIDGDVRLLLYFLAVAEELHFGRAARKLHVSQPAVSRGVAKLETMLSVDLFVRSGRSVRLSEAGELLYARVPKALENLTQALEDTRAFGLGEGGHLAVSFLPSARFLVMPAVKRFRERFPAIQLALHEALDERQFNELSAGRTDLGIVRSQRAGDNLVFKRLVNAQLCVALPRDHHLAREHELTYGQLADEPFVLWPRSDSPEGFDHVLAGCHRAGFEPRIAAETSEAQTVAALIAAGVGVSILGSSLRFVIDSSIEFVPLRDEYDTLYVVCRPEEQRVRQHFVDVLFGEA